MPKVSVIVATFHGRYIEQTLASIRDQTFDDFEVLVLDDAASAECAAIVERFDARFFYYSNDPHLGVALNHRRGIELAAGDFVAIVNHDDLWDPHLLEQLVQGIEEYPQAVAAFSRTLVAGPDGRYDAERTRRAWESWKQTELPLGLITDWFDATGRLGFPVVVSAILRTESLRRFEIPAAVGGVYDLWLGYRLARMGPLVHVENALGYWREHEGNLTKLRSARQAVELVYVDTHALIDHVLPARLRLAAARRLPAEIAHLAWNAVRPRRPGPA